MDGGFPRLYRNICREKVKYQLARFGENYRNIEKLPDLPVAALTAQPLAALPPYGCGMPLAGTQSIPAISKPQFGTKSLADRSCNLIRGSLGIQAQGENPA